MEKETKKLIEETIISLLQKMGFSEETVEIQDADDEEGVVCNIITGSDSHFLIGQHGINLQALQHISRLIVRKKTDEKIKFILDINDYRKQKNQSVIEQAVAAANEAVSLGRAVVMKPMSTYERRIVHLELSKDKRVVTESTGEGESRKVIIKPADQLTL
jgi:spoIIIJ-associated protein